MITVVAKGNYKLVETQSQTKILSLDGQAYAWVWAKNIGEILITTHRPHKIDHVLAMGSYRLYEVEGEAKYADLLHLELLVGPGRWQGYLLLTGLPTDKKTRSRIIPTTELITPSK